MRALVTNDDGIDSPGLAELARVVVAAGLDVVVAAPTAQSSGASAAIIAHRAHGRARMRAHRLEGLPDVPAWAVEAPAGPYRGDRVDRVVRPAARPSTVRSLNVPDHPADRLRELRHAPAGRVRVGHRARGRVPPSSAIAPSGSSSGLPW